MYCLCNTEIPDPAGYMNTEHVVTQADNTGFVLDMLKCSGKW